MKMEKYFLYNFFYTYLFIINKFIYLIITVFIEEKNLIHNLLIYTKTN